MLGPIAHRRYRKDTVRACKIPVLTMDRHRNGCQCSTTAALPASRGPRWTDGASEIPIAPAEPGALLPASSFPGGFRTPARSRPRRGQCRAGIRNPSQLRTCASQQIAILIRSPYRRGQGGWPRTLRPKRLGGFERCLDHGRSAIFPLSERAPREGGESVFQDFEPVPR